MQFLKNCKDLIFSLLKKNFQAVANKKFILKTDLQFCRLFVMASKKKMIFSEQKKICIL